MEKRGLNISRNNTEYLGTTSTKTHRSIFTTLVDRWRTGCGRQPQSAERMEELVECLECCDTGK